METVPRWALISAHAVPLCVLPSGLWRIAAWLELMPGVHASTHPYDAAMGAYMVLLTIVSEGLALLTLGLVRPWGEVIPSCVPWLGGRPVPTRAAVWAASCGAAALVAIPISHVVMQAMDVQFRPAIGDEGGTLPRSGFWFGLTAAAYAPLLAWPPLLAAVTWAYWRRRTGRDQVGYCRQYS